MPHKDIPLNERIILALDVPTADAAKGLVERLESHIRFYKVGLQLFLADGFNIIRWITGRGHKVMADLKLFDVPETVKLAVRQLRDKGVAFTTVHGNDPILRAAVSEKGDLKILAVTLLTSFGEEDMKEFFGEKVKIEDFVYMRARRALEVGCDGVVSSGLEAKRLRKGLGEKLLIVTPGIRPGKNTVDEDDQRRIATAGEAISGGADYVVVGRPITHADDPVSVVEHMQADIKKTVSG